MEPELSLVQERLVTRFESRLEPDAIAVTEQDGTAKRSYRVPLENLAAAPVEVTIWSKPKLWAAGVFMALSAGMVILEVQGGDIGEGAAVFYVRPCGNGGIALCQVPTYLVVEGTPVLVLMKDRPRLMR